MIESAPKTVADLESLVGKYRFPTILADPPWRYANTASRGAAENHYRTLSMEALCELPVEQLAHENAHLHLWTTNAFLEPSFSLIRSWGFEFKSCLVWIKPTIGLGNYYRLSHEFLMLGVRGKLRFRRKDVPSWIMAPRSRHSQKPFNVRRLIEQVSHGPYLELFGREEQHEAGWTVFGDQVERRLF